MSQFVETKSQSEKILRAAFKCLSEKGYAQVSLRDIADEADVVLSQLHYYYKNKEGLFTEVIKSLAKQYLSEFEAHLKLGTTGVEKVSDLVSYFKIALKEHPEFFKLLFDLTSMSLWSETLKKILNDLFQDLAVLIEKNIVDNLPNLNQSGSGDPKGLSKMILGALIGTSMQILLTGDADHDIQSLSALNGLLG